MPRTTTRSLRRDDRSADHPEDSREWSAHTSAHSHNSRLGSMDTYSKEGRGLPWWTPGARLEVVDTMDNDSGQRRVNRTPRRQPIATRGSGYDGGSTTRP